MVKKTIFTDPMPCPYCGKDPVIVKAKGQPWRVTCPWLDCKAHASSYGDTERKAIDKWNKGEVVKE